MVSIKRSRICSSVTICIKTSIIILCPIGKSCLTFDQWAEYNFGKECSMKYQNLTKFLPCFAEGQSGGKWQGGKQADRQVIMPYVAYNEKNRGIYSGVFAQ